MQRVTSKPAPTPCRAMCKSAPRTTSAPIGFVAVERVFFNCALEAVTHFDRLVAPRMEACSAATVLVSHIKSGLGNRSEQIFHFDHCEEVERFVDQMAQWAVEGRARC